MSELQEHFIFALQGNSLVDAPADVVWALRACATHSLLQRKAGRLDSGDERSGIIRLGLWKPNHGVPTIQ